MASEQRKTLEDLRGFLRDRESLLSERGAAAYAAALDAALRELDAAAALRAELPGLIRAVSGPLRDRSAFVRAMRRLCELLPGLASPAEGTPHAAGGKEDGDE